MTVNPYETDALLAQYLLFHYGCHGDQLPWQQGPTDALEYPTRTVTALLDDSRLGSDSRALDLGCAVGRSSFELARYCGEVLGIDYSQRFVDAAEMLRKRGSIPYRFPVEGSIEEEAVAVLPQAIEVERVSFQQGDACALDSKLSSFDVVHMANLIDRLPDPMLCLQRLPALVKPGGQLLITSPFTWLEEYTPTEKWLGGRTDMSAAPLGTEAALCEILAPDFTLDFRTDLPFVIREHARKYQWSMAFGGRWIRHL